MLETVDPHELVKVDSDPDEAMLRILAGGGMDEPNEDLDAGLELPSEEPGI
jgi:hypothetical protein